ncbi:hypothetical protein [Persephonella sp.]
MRWNIEKYIIDGLREKIGDVNFVQEEYSSQYHTVSRATTYIDGKKVKLTPVSFGFKGEYIEGPLIRLDRAEPHIALENLSGKILYIREIDDLSIFHHIKKAEPLAVITNTEPGKPLYSPEFPVFYIHSFLKTDSLQIKIKTKSHNRQFKNVYFDSGVGARFIYIHFPFDSRFVEENQLHFYGSYRCMVELVEKLVRLKHPKGFRLRFIFTDTYLSDYEGLNHHLKNAGIQPVSIFNIENCGLGNEKFIISTVEDSILDRFHYLRIKNLLQKINLKNEFEKLKDYSTINKAGTPVVWLASQPNRFMYHLKKEFLNGKLINKSVNTLFYLINNIYKVSG